MVHEKPEAKARHEKINPFDSLLLILGGFASLFYFISLKINQEKYIDEKGNIWIRTHVFKSPASKELWRISVFILVLFMLRGGYLFVKI